MAEPNRYPRETDEDQPVTVTVDGEPITDAAGVDVAVVPRGVRPTTWVPAVQVDEARIGFRITGLAPGLWDVWARPTVAGRRPVIPAGTIQIT